MSDILRADERQLYDDVADADDINPDSIRQNIYEILQDYEVDGRCFQEVLEQVDLLIQMATQQAKRNQNKNHD